MILFENSPRKLSILNQVFNILSLMRLFNNFSCLNSDPFSAVDCYNLRIKFLPKYGSSVRFKNVF